MKRREVELAVSARLGFCPNCHEIHFMLFDKDGNPFAEVLIDETIGVPLIEALHDALYEQAAFKDEKTNPTRGF